MQLDDCLKKISRPFVDSLSRVGHAFMVGVVCLLSACSDAGQGEVARISHDFIGKQVLYSFPVTYTSTSARPSEANPAHDQGSEPIFLPSTPYRCQWQSRRWQIDGNGRPTSITLSCLFSMEAFPWPKTYEELAIMFRSNDHARLIAAWNLEDDQYRISRFEIRISVEGERYRSQNLSSDIQQIEVLEYGMEFPKSSEDELRFGLRSKLPYRLNSGEPLGEPIVTIDIQGIAQPKPSWATF